MFNALDLDATKLTLLSGRSKLDAFACIVFVQLARQIMRSCHSY